MEKIFLSDYMNNCLKYNFMILGSLGTCTCHMPHSMTNNSSTLTQVIFFKKKATQIQSSNRRAALHLKLSSLSEVRLLLTLCKGNLLSNSDRLTQGPKR